MRWGEGVERTVRWGSGPMAEEGHPGRLAVELKGHETTATTCRCWSSIVHTALAHTHSV